MSKQAQIKASEALDYIYKAARMAPLTADDHSALHRFYQSVQEILADKEKSDKYNLKNIKREEDDAQASSVPSA